MNNELGMKPPIGSLLSPYMVDTLHFVQRAGTLYLLTRYVRLSIGPCVDTGRERKKKSLPCMSFLFTLNGNAKDKHEKNKLHSWCLADSVLGLYLTRKHAVLSFMV